MAGTTPITMAIINIMSGLSSSMMTTPSDYLITKMPKRNKKEDR